MSRHDLIWEEPPTRWEEAPYLGNGNMGSMVYVDKKRNAIRFQMFRVDVQDHQDNTRGWTAYSRPRFMIGSFYLQPKGKVTGCSWRHDLWNATLRGTITTDRGEIQFTHLIHSADMIADIAIKASKNEGDCEWEFVPDKPETTRPGYPKKQSQVEDFATRYGDHYRQTLKLFEPNPDPVITSDGAFSISEQNLLASGQHSVVWTVKATEPNRQILTASIEASYPDSSATTKAILNVQKKIAEDRSDWLSRHQSWWNAYYPESFVSIPDARLESFYWHQIYKMASATRRNRPMMDTAGPWMQPTPWPYITWDLNVQLCYWPTLASNRLHLGESLVNTLHRNRQNLIQNVRPIEWQSDSAYIPVVSAQDLIEPRNGDKRYYKCVGNLPWAMHNCWLQYRYSMDDELLRGKIYPLLKRAINMYLHMLIEGDDGKLHLPETYSPEYGHSTDCNYDLALLKWGCGALIASADRLQMDDPLIPTWRDIVDRLTDFPVDENGFRIGKSTPFARSHRHYSHLLMAYPLYLVNIEQGSDQSELIQKSLKHWISFERSLQGYSYTGASSISAALGQGNDALKYLKGLEKFLQPNGLYKEAGPVMETPLSAAQSIHDMLLQSWGDTIRVFPAVPDVWEDATFHQMRAEGAFLISAVRKNGLTRWVRIESLAGEPCKIRPDLNGAVRVLSDRDVKIIEHPGGIFELDLQKAEVAWLVPQGENTELSVYPVPKPPTASERFGLPSRP